MEKDFVVEFDADFAGIKGDTGPGFSRIGIGHYRFKIVDADQHTKEGEKPHTMLKLGCRVEEAVGEKSDPESVGLMRDLYCGGPASPKRMKQTTKGLMEAIGMSGTRITASQLIGREFVATIYWKASGEQMQADGSTRRYVNPEMCNIRKIGAEPPATFDPWAFSRPATNYLRDQYGEVFNEGGAPEAAPWEADAAATDMAQASSDAGFRPETDADKNVHEYRAAIKLELPTAAAARNGLIGAGFDPDGPINVDLLSDELKKRYVEKFGGAAALPTLGGLPPLGGAPNGPSAPRTGTRKPAPGAPAGR